MRFVAKTFLIFFGHLTSMFVIIVGANFIGTGTDGKRGGPRQSTTRYHFPLAGQTTQIILSYAAGDVTRKRI